MLTDVCNYVHNYFEHAIYTGTFNVEDGRIDDLDSLVAPGQRFKVCGSALNDGIYTYKSDAIYNDDGDTSVAMADETFTGTITAMAVPVAFLDILSEIKTWQAKNQAVLETPYQSESFGGYSYSKASGSGSNAGGALSWQDVYRARLNAYRRIS